MQQLSRQQEGEAPVKKMQHCATLINDLEGGGGEFVGEGSMVGGLDEPAPPTSVTRVLVVSRVLSLLPVLSLFRGFFSGFSGFLPSTKTSRLKGLPCLNIDYSITSLCSSSTVFHTLFARMCVPTSRTTNKRLTPFNCNFHCFIASCFSFFLSFAKES